VEEIQSVHAPTIRKPKFLWFAVQWNMQVTGLTLSAIQTFE
jgi:hypothetical protein